MFADVRVDSAERIVHKVDVAVLVDGSSHTDSLLLSSTQVNALKQFKQTISK